MPDTTVSTEQIEAQRAQILTDIATIHEIRKRWTGDVGGADLRISAINEGAMPDEASLYGRRIDSALEQLERAAQQTSTHLHTLRYNLGNVLELIREARQRRR